MKYNSRTWIEIDTNILERNIASMKLQLKKRVAFAGLVKANAYGHGMKEVAKILIKQHATFLAVSYLEEAITLRDAGITHPILMLSQPLPGTAMAIIKNKITPAIYDLACAKHISLIAKRDNTIIPVHLKIDTGLHRLGFSLENAISAVIEISRLPGIRIEGIYTHLVNSYAIHTDYTKKQLILFEKFIKNVHALGIHPQYIHAANSAAHAWIPDAQYNLVRFGMAMFGLQPSDERNYPFGIKQCFTWKTRILQIKKIAKGENVGYGDTWHAPEDMIIATLAVGYADGFRRTPYNFGSVLCNGEKAPIISNVQMSQTMVDISHIPHVRENDIVVIVGKQGKENISFEDIAYITRTTNEEIATGISAIIPRIYT